MRLAFAVIAAGVLMAGAAIASAPVSGARVELASVPSGAVVQSAETDGQGVAVFSSVASGVYDVSVPPPSASENHDSGRFAHIVIRVGELAPTSARAGLPVGTQRLRIVVPEGEAQQISVQTEID